MGKLNHTRAKMRDRQHQPVLTSPEIFNCIAVDTARIIAGMGQGPRPPCKRIDPNSPEGRAIAARYTAKPP